MNHVTGTVLYQSAIECCCRTEGCDVYVEMGPDETLTRMSGGIVASLGEDANCVRGSYNALHSRVDDATYSPRL